MKNTVKKPGSGRRDKQPKETPTWGIAMLFPRQGQWSVEEYLDLNTNHLVEFSDGILEFLPMPSTLHQWIVVCFWELLNSFVREGKLGLALPAPLPVQLWSRKFREPDVVFMLQEHADRVRKKYWQGADLAMEVISDTPKDRRRDLVVKRSEYARAGISEYWMIDPKLKQITVLWLQDKKYVVHGVFKKAEATSRLLPGFALNPEILFAGPQMGR